MKNQEQLILDHMRHMISQSCRIQDRNQNPYQNFQNDLLRHFFKAADVSIDPDQQVISIFTADPVIRERHNPYSLKNVVTINVAYTNLEETLKGCLEVGEDHYSFYSSLLFTNRNLNETSQELNLSA